jgi:hypothetical protein
MDHRCRPGSIDGPSMLFQSLRDHETASLRFDETGLL